MKEVKHQEHSKTTALDMCIPRCFVCVEVKGKRREPVSTLSCFVTCVFALALDNFGLDL